MAGGALKSLKELAGAATYAVYYFATPRTRSAPSRTEAAQPRRGHAWHGHGHKVKH